MRLSAGRLLKVMLGVAVSVGLLAYLLWNADLRAIGTRLAQTHWGFLAASIMLNFLSIFARARRWYYLFPPGSRPSHLFNAVMIGYMGNNVLPLRAGEVLRAYVAARRGQRFWTTVATLVVDRVLDGLAIGLMLACLFLTLPVPRELQWAALVFLSVDLIAVLVLALIAVAPDRCRWLVQALTGRVAAVERSLVKLLETFNEGLRGVRTPRHLLPIISWSTAIWLFWAVGVWAALRAAHLDLPFGAAWTVLAFMGLGVSLPSSPGFVGIIQAAAVLALALFAVPHDDALSFSFLFHASQAVPVTLWGLILLAVEHVSLSVATGSAPAQANPSQG